MVGHDAPGFRAVVDAIATPPEGYWKVYEFACPECGTDVRLSVFYRTDRDDGGWRQTACEPGLHAAAQPMSFDRRTDAPKLNCYVKSVEA